MSVVTCVRHSRALVYVTWYSGCGHVSVWVLLLLFFKLLFVSLADCCWCCFGGSFVFVVFSCFCCCCFVFRFWGVFFFFFFFFFFVFLVCLFVLLLSSCFWELVVFVSVWVVVVVSVVAVVIWGGRWCDVFGFVVCTKPVVSQAPQHFRSSKTHATCGGYFAHHWTIHARSVIPVFTPACKYSHSGFRKWMSQLNINACQSSLGFPFHSLFIANSLNLWRLLCATCHLSGSLETVQHRRASMTWVWLSASTDLHCQAGFWNLTRQHSLRF